MELYIGPRDVAKLTSLAPATIYGQLEAGNLPGKRVGRRWLIKITDIKAHLGVSDEDIAQARELVTSEKAARKAGKKSK